MQKVYLLFNKKIGRLMGAYASEDLANARKKILEEAHKVLLQDVPEYFVKPVVVHGATESKVPQEEL